MISQTNKLRSTIELLSYEIIHSKMSSEKESYIEISDESGCSERKYDWITKESKTEDRIYTPQGPSHWDTNSIYVPQSSSNLCETNAKPSKQKRIRTAFTTQQINILEEFFSKDRYVTRSDRAELATLLGLEDRAIKVWFQNRRMKYKKDNQRQGETICTSTTEESAEDIPNTWNQECFDLYEQGIPNPAIENLGSLVAQCITGDGIYYSDSLNPHTTLPPVHDASPVKTWHQDQNEMCYNIHYMN